MRYWEPSSDPELDAIHAAACRLLAELGLRIQAPEAVEVLVEAGAQKVDDHTVRLPRAMVEKAIATAPAQFAVYDRRGGHLVIGDHSHHHLVGATMTQVLDYPGWQRRSATLTDARQFTRLVDALDCVDWAAPVVEPRDVAEGTGEILSCAELLKNTAKFCLACPADYRANLAFVEMAKAATRTDDLSRRPTIALLATVVPGFEIDTEAARTMLLAGREGVPIVLMGGAIAGAQAPATMAGGLAMKLAGQLAGLCLVQAVRPGSPCLLNWGLVKLDMRTAALEEAGPEYFLAMGVGAQLSRRYGIPSYACPAADSKRADFQAGVEIAQGLQTALLAGIHVTVNAGTASKCSCASYELLVLHHELLRNAGRVRRGMRVDDETLAVEMMKEVGIRGEYMVHPHTLRWIRNREEFMHKDLFDATDIHAEYADLCAKAQQRWQQLLATHEVPVDAADQQAIDAVAAQYIARRQRP